MYPLCSENGKHTSSHGTAQIRPLVIIQGRQKQKHVHLDLRSGLAEKFHSITEIPQPQLAHTDTHHNFSVLNSRVLICSFVSQLQRVKTSMLVPTNPKQSPPNHPPVPLATEMETATRFLATALGADKTSSAAADALAFTAPFTFLLLLFCSSGNSGLVS